MRRLSIAGTFVFGLVIATVSIGNAASTGGYSPAVYPGSERIHSEKSSQNASASAAVHASSSSSEGPLVRKCIPQACGTPWCYMTRNP